MGSRRPARGGSAGSKCSDLVFPTPRVIRTEPPRTQDHGPRTQPMRPTQRLTGQQGALLVVDMQEKLLAMIPVHDRVVAHSVALIRGAQALGLPVWATEQYPRGLGPSAAAIAELIPERPAKTTFHCCGI